MFVAAHCATPGVSGLSVTVKHGARKPFCRAGRPAERDLRKLALQSQIIVAQVGEVVGDIMFPPSFPGVARRIFDGIRFCKYCLFTRLSFSANGATYPARVAQEKSPAGSWQGLEVDRDEAHRFEIRVVGFRP